MNTSVQDILSQEVVVLLTGSNTGNEVAAGVVCGLFALGLAWSSVNLCISPYKNVFFYVAACCTIRVVTFALRADLQKHYSDTKMIVYEVFFAVGFIPLVKALLHLYSHWNQPASTRLPRQGGRGPVRGLIAFFFRDGRTLAEKVERLGMVILVVGAVVNIVGATDSFNTSPSATLTSYQKGMDLRKAGYTMYLVVIGSLDILILLAAAFRHSNMYKLSTKNSLLLLFGLELCSLLLTCKSVFQVIAIYVNVDLFFRQKFFYPLEVLPELLTIVILNLPGFVSGLMGGSTPVIMPEGKTAGENPVSSAGAATPTEAPYAPTV